MLAAEDIGGDGIGVLLLQVTEVLVAQVVTVADHVVPVLGPCHGVERVGIVADGVETAHDTTHRGTCDDVDGDARFLQYFQHTDMCHTLGTAAAQHNCHFLTPTLCLGRRSTH